MMYLIYRVFVFLWRRGVPGRPHFGVYLGSRTTLDPCCGDGRRWVCYYTLVGFFSDRFLRAEVA